MAWFVNIADLAYLHESANFIAQIMQNWSHWILPTYHLCNASVLNKLYYAKFYNVNIKTDFN